MPDRRIVERRRGLRLGLFHVPFHSRTGAFFVDHDLVPHLASMPSLDRGPTARPASNCRRWNSWRSFCRSCPCHMSISCAMLGVWRRTARFGMRSPQRHASRMWTEMKRTLEHLAPAPCAQRLLSGARHAARRPRSLAHRTAARGTKGRLECLSVSLSVTELHAL